MMFDAFPAQKSPEVLLAVAVDARLRVLIRIRLEVEGANDQHPQTTQFIAAEPAPSQPNRCTAADAVDAAGWHHGSACAAPPRLPPPTRIVLAPTSSSSAAIMACGPKDRVAGRQPLSSAMWMAPSSHLAVELTRAPRVVATVACLAVRCPRRSGILFLRGASAVAHVVL